jgi:hypothetical protein
MATPARRIEKAVLTKHGNDWQRRFTEGVGPCKGNCKQREYDRTYFAELIGSDRASALEPGVEELKEEQ